MSEGRPKRVEHMGPQHKHTPIFVSEGLIMSVCVEYELRRWMFMKDLVEAYGQVFENVPFDYSYPHATVNGTCQKEAFKLMKTTGLTYCEGVIMVLSPQGIVPMIHAWCCTEDGRLVDPTCHAHQHNGRLMYIGIPFLHNYIEAWERQYGFPGVLDGHPELGDSVGVYADDPSEWRCPCP